MLLIVHLYCVKSNTRLRSPLYYIRNIIITITEYWYHYTVRNICTSTQDIFLFDRSNFEKCSHSRNKPTLNKTRWQKISRGESKTKHVAYGTISISQCEWLKIRAAFGSKIFMKHARASWDVREMTGALFDWSPIIFFTVGKFSADWRTILFKIG